MSFPIVIFNLVDVIFVRFANVFIDLFSFV